MKMNENYVKTSNLSTWSGEQCLETWNKSIPATGCALFHHPHHPADPSQSIHPASHPILPQWAYIRNSTRCTELTPRRISVSPHRDFPDFLFKSRHFLPPVGIPSALSFNRSNRTCCYGYNLQLSRTTTTTMRDQWQLFRHDLFMRRARVWEFCESDNYNACASS